MTHVPPAGRLCYSDVGDSLLTSRLEELKHPPKFHVFGHDHDHVGVRCDNGTISLNGAQEQLLRFDRRAGGFAWIFDVRVDEEEESDQDGQQMEAEVSPRRGEGNPLPTFEPMLSSDA
eukprot:jgi/Bigna1/83464/fgenesh1_pg.109_\